VDAGDLGEDLDAATSREDLPTPGPGGAWEAPTPIEPAGKAASESPRVALEATSGSALVAWVEGSALRVRRFDGPTGRWIEPVTVEDRGFPFDPRLAVDGAGRAVLAWYQAESFAGAELAGVWVSRSPDGRSWSTPKRLRVGDVRGSLALGLSRAGAGRLAWEERRQNVATLWSVSFDADSWGEPAQASVDDRARSPFERAPRIALADDGGGLLVWRETEAADPRRRPGLVASVLTPGSLGAPRQLLDGAEVGEAAVAVGTIGAGLVAWIEGEGPARTLRSARLDRGAGWRPTEKVLEAQDLSGVAAAVDADGNATLAWAQKGRAAGQAVYAARSAAEGPWTSPVPLDTIELPPSDRTDGPEPILGVDRAGHVHALWRRKVDETTTALVTRRFRAGGTWTAEQTIAERSKLAVVQPVLSVADDGRALAAFGYLDLARSGAAEAERAFVALFR
jgi:hypothetical protein